MQNTEPQNPADSPTEFLWKVHTYLSDMSKFADAKLVVTIGFASAFAGYVLPKITIREAFTLPLSAYPLVGATSIALFLVAIGFGFAGVFPRLTWIRHGRSKDLGIIFWRAILAHSDSNAYKTYSDSLTPVQARDHLAEQNFTIAGVVDRKFWCLEWSTFFVMVASVFGVLYLAML